MGNNIKLPRRRIGTFEQNPQVNANKSNGILV